MKSDHALRTNLTQGNVSLTLSVPIKNVDTIVGNATILNFKLVPGDNKLPMFGIIDNTKVLPALVGGKVNMTIIGQNATYNGQHLTYYVSLPPQASWSRPSVTFTDPQIGEGPTQQRSRLRDERPTNPR